MCFVDVITVNLGSYRKDSGEPISMISSTDFDPAFVLELAAATGWN
jgi:hypothetical protein